MNQNEINKLKELLGNEFTPEELEKIFQEDPTLASSIDPLRSLFQKAKNEPIPPLRSNFTQQTLEQIEKPRLWASFFESILTLRNLATATACALTFVIGLYLRPYLFHPSILPPGLSIRETTGPGNEKLFYVRFAVQQPGANSVSVAGDFSQWMERPLTLINSEKGIFSAELPVPEGTYNYSFVVDGKKWIADPSADRMVEDGFGHKNSVINL
jgi:hypothetical protein